MEGSSSSAKLLKIPCIVVWLTIVAVGTSLPELVTYGFSYTKREIDKREGIVMLLSYVAYMAYAICR